MHLDDSIQYLKGVGPARGKLFHALGIDSLRDLLFTAPRTYLDRSNLTTIADAAPHGDAEIMVIAELKNFQERRPARQNRGVRLVTQALFTDRTGEIEAVWFNSPWVKNLLGKVEAPLLIYGRGKRERGRLLMSHPHLNPTEAGSVDADKIPLAAGKIVPVYASTEGLRDKIWLRSVDFALTEVLAEVPEIYPPDFLRAFDLLPRQTALRELHFPENFAMRDRARNRLAWDEALFLQLEMLKRREGRIANNPAAAIKITLQIDSRIRGLFPFRPTSAQEKVIAEISADLVAAQPMQRLLQGDVGSGKTIVAIYAILATVANHRQACLMAPTGVVAAQHFSTIEKMLAAGGHSRVRCKLLVSGMKKRERDLLRAELAAGGIDILIATHAAIEPDIAFKHLALAVIDEQHKFGVAQRDALVQKGEAVNVLVMTATPIPRSLALTVYGDLEVSVIDKLPPGRQPITTRLIDAKNLPKTWETIRAELAKGRQAFVVSPLREENEDYLSAIEAFEKFRAHELAGFAVGLLHGQMERDEQRKIMDDFHARRIQALVCTVVVEVGVDVPNANVMLILHAERFGLAQLHQLRGRIGRGREPGFFYLLTATDAAAKERLQILTETADGFRIAQTDLQMRGPGEFLGVKQHGLPNFRILDLARDWEIIHRARDAAKKLLPELASPRFSILVDELNKFHATVLANDAVAPNSVV